MNTRDPDGNADGNPTRFRDLPPEQSDLVADLASRIFGRPAIQTLRDRGPSLEHRLLAAESVARDTLAENRVLRDWLDELKDELRELRAARKGSGHPRNRFFPYRREGLEETISDASNEPPRFRTALDIAEAGLPEIRYLINDLLPEEALVLLTGAAKGGGKTTFTVHLARALLTGLPFLGCPARRTPVVYLTEQPESNFFDGYLRPVGLEAHPDLHLLFGYQAAGTPWLHLVEAAVEACRRSGARLLVIDTFLHFARLTGDRENASGAVQEALRPLQHAVAADGLTLIVVHHDRKSGGDVYSAGRGSSAFQGAVDLIVNLALPEGNQRPTLREMRTTGRYGEVPAQLMIELTGEGYQALGSGQALAARFARDLALLVAPTSEAEAQDAGALLETARELDSTVSKTTFRSTLARLAGTGDLRTLGTGKRGDPYRYYRPLDAPLPGP